MTQAAARTLHWIRTPTVGADECFADGLLNLCFNAADRHVALGRADDIALIGPSLVEESIVDLTFADLTERSAKLGGILRALEIRSGDRVYLDLPNSVELVLAMLAVARIGAAFLMAEPDQVVSDASAVISTELRPNERCIQVVPAARAAAGGDAGGRGGGAGGGYDYRSLMRSAAIQPVESVPVLATSPFRLTWSYGEYPTVCDTGPHAAELVKRAQSPEQMSDPGAEHPCAILAPLVVGEHQSLLL